MIKKATPKKKKTVLFISTGNTCRSPMAASYLAKLLEEKKVKNIEVRSAGVSTVAGLVATVESVQMLEKEGVDLHKHRSRQITEDMIKKADLILGMTPYHIQTAYRISTFARGKTYMMTEYARSDMRNPQIPDPMGCTYEVYKKCFTKIKKAVKKLVKTDYFLNETPKNAKNLEDMKIVKKGLKGKAAVDDYDDESTDD